jgi:hypothetical protein
MRLKSIVLITSLGILQFATAQEPDKTAPADSAKVYKALREIAEKKTFSKWLFSIIFTIPENVKKPPKRRTKRIVQKSYNYFEGKIIRDINILTLDPFGYDIRDTSIKPNGFVRITGNKLHVKTLPVAIRNLLLFKSNQPFDSLLVKESERLIRRQKYVHDVILQTHLVKKDSVDIHIRILDVWSLTPKGSISASAMSLGFTDQNFLGTGQQFDNIYGLDFKTKRSAYQISYYIPNIRNSFIGARLQYHLNQDRSFIKLFEVERQFYSTFTKWGGGIRFGQNLNRDSIIFPDSTKFLQNFKFNTQDVWLAKAWRIFGGQSEFQRSANYIASVRFQHINYLERPVEVYDSLRIYTNEKFLYFALGISSRRYIQDKFIFNYGLVEDVPKGATYSITGGYQIKNNRGRWYLGFKSSWGDYYPWGYLSTNLEYGRFLYKGSFEEGALDVGINYFSELWDIGKWKIRQFVKPHVTIGIRRLPTDKIYINEEYGIVGFSAKDVFGSHKILLTLQTQSYAPWNLIGFRFGPYLVYSMGLLGNNTHGFKNAKVYSLFGLGVLLKNEFLVFKTFQVSLAFYPIIPGKGNNISKFNAYRTNDFGFRDFDIEKPTTVSYR